jgi:hypothetical protein
MNADDSTKLALEHARSLFIYHAGQRIQSLNFYFVAITLFLTGFGFVASSNLGPAGRAFVGIVLALAGFRITQLFQALDKRNEELVHCDESLLKDAEAALTKVSDPVVSAWEVTALSEKPEKGAKRYAKIVPSIFHLYMTVSILGGIYFACPWVSGVVWPWLTGRLR